MNLALPQNPETVGCGLPRQANGRIAAWFCRWSLAVYLFIVVAQSLVQVLYINADQDVRHAGITGTDGQAYYAFVRSVCIDGDLDFQNEFYQYNYNKHGFQTPDSLPRSPVTGLYFNRFPIGFSVFLIPFFLLAHAATLLGNAAGLWNLEPDGYTALYQLTVPIGTMFYGALAYWTTQRILLRFFSPWTAACATFVTFLAYQGSFSIIIFWCNPHLHALLVFNLLLLLAFRVQEEKDGAGTWAGLGALVGLSALLRTEAVLFALLPFLLFCHRAWNLRRRSDDKSLRPILPLIGRTAAAPVACLAVFLPQAVVWSLMWGEIVRPSWLLPALRDSQITFNWRHPVFLQILFSTRHGLFYWSPILLIGLAGFVWFAFSKRAGIALRLALAQLLAVYFFYSCWSIWWMGHSFGARQFISVTAPFAIGVGFLMERFRRRPGAIAGISACLVGWNWSMLWMFLNGHVPRSEGFPWWLPSRNSVTFCPEYSHEKKPEEKPAT